MTLNIELEGVPAEAIPTTARFAHYMGVVCQLNGSLIEKVTVTGDHRVGPEQTSPDGTDLTLGFDRLPNLQGGSPSAIAVWCGVSVHGIAHSRYSPRTNEPLRHTLAQKKLHRTWNMIEDARIERLLLRDFPGWQPHLMGMANYLFIKPRRGEKKRDLAGVFPLLAGRTYLPLALRQEAFEAFATEHSDYIADAVRDLIFRYMRLVDPGSADHDETIDIVTRLRSLLGSDYGTDCGSSNVEEDGTERAWTDPGDPSEDDDAEPGDDEGDDGNQTVTDDGEPSEDDGDEGEPGEGGTDGEPSEGDDEGEPGEGDDDEGEPGDGGTDGDDDGDDEGEPGDDGTDGNDDDEGDLTDDDGEPDDDEGDINPGGTGEGGGGTATSRLVDWSDAIDSALMQDERLNDLRESILSGPMPEIKLHERTCNTYQVPPLVALAEQDIARELRVLMDGARPGMKRRIDRGRFNVSRVVREGGSTRPEEMFDRHDPGAVRATGCALAFLADASASMDSVRMAGAMESLWSIDRAVQSVRGAFKAWTFGSTGNEMPRSGVDVQMPVELDGNTMPFIPLSSAQAWLSRQKEPNKLCIIATDGMWSGVQDCHRVMESMIVSGVQVSVFGIQRDVSQHERTGASTFMIESAADIGPAVGMMLVNRVKSALHR